MTATSNLNMAFGDDGSDQLYFIGNQNQLFGGEGHDWLGVNGNNNALAGGNGNEVWMGASGNSNTLNGEGGSDSLYVNGDRQLAASAAPTPIGSAPAAPAMPFTAPPATSGWAPPATATILIGGDDGDTLFSVGGNFLYGEGGDDWLGCSGNNNDAQRRPGQRLSGGERQQQHARRRRRQRHAGRAAAPMPPTGSCSTPAMAWTPSATSRGTGPAAPTSSTSTASGSTSATLQQYLSFQAGGVAVITIDAATKLTIANGIPPNGFLASDFIF